MNQTFTVTGMTCGHCEASVKRALLQLDPGAQVQIDRSQNKVEVSGSQQSREALAAAIREEGYDVAA
ncbi:MAG: cation transporter [Burkholderiales bacterium]|nr:cation transporter [Burkholderiales bacterium]